MGASGGVCTAVRLVGAVLAVIVSITDVRWIGADAGATLELARSTFKLRCSETPKKVTQPEERTAPPPHPHP